MDEDSTSVSITPSFSSTHYEASSKFSGYSYSTESNEQNNFIKFEKGISVDSSFIAQIMVGNKTMKKVAVEGQQSFIFQG